MGHLITVPQDVEASPPCSYKFRGIVKITLIRNLIPLKMIEREAYKRPI